MFIYIGTVNTADLSILVKNNTAFTITKTYFKHFEQYLVHHQ